MQVFHSSHLNHLPGKELDLKSIAGYEVKAETPVALSSGSNRRAESEFDSRTRSLATPFTHSLESDFNHSGGSFVLHSLYITRRERSNQGAYSHIETSEA